MRRPCGALFGMLFGALFGASSGLPGFPGMAPQTRPRGGAESCPESTGWRRPPPTPSSAPMRVLFAALPAAALAALTVTVGCGRGTPPVPSEAAPTTEAPAPTTDAPVTSIEITGDDQMRYSTTAFTVAAGSEVTLTFRNVGQQPKELYGHNVVILQSTTDVSAFAAAAMSAPENIPAGREAEMVAHTRLLGPGETDTITFTAPTAPGTYTYLCTFPGHAAIMRGTMTVVG